MLNGIHSMVKTGKKHFSGVTLLNVPEIWLGAYRWTLIGRGYEYHVKFYDVP